jgi:predicted Zn-dependent protease
VCWFIRLIQVKVKIYTTYVAEKFSLACAILFLFGDDEIHKINFSKSYYYSVVIVWLEWVKNCDFKIIRITTSDRWRRVFWFYFYFNYNGYDYCAIWAAITIKRYYININAREKLLLLIIFRKTKKNYCGRKKFVDFSEK